MVRAEGIEPTTKRWQRLILPLNYARNVWKRGRDSNSHKEDLQSTALPFRHLAILVQPRGIEPRSQRFQRRAFT